ncbi:hypothetical protein Ccrd_007305 [Cynara cardunculus var. scolymus]|uniref:Uncharacterized protein n=1 Tax=Cynara cardunculus var. scolymus TaxID=59895 RepID=A0A103XH54_CYNCS|nr:hypothetical protein Ccrd_007305 [Cynara cardunculus var. scolymus]
MLTSLKTAHLIGSNGLKLANHSFPKLSTTSNHWMLRKTLLYLTFTAGIYPQDVQALFEYPPCYSRKVWRKDSPLFPLETSCVGKT